VIIWVGSVHLAYHYAVDGLVSVVAMAAIWRGSDTLLSAWDRRCARLPRGGTAPATA
jgi:hypothetical protein